ncbi:putative homoserine O-acetyltransferase [Zopfochytrium polystomum]|nr:putative homoserine O-acetyltransferase [Zopfochytrium polystomum]
MKFSEYSSFVADQSVHVLDKLELDCGVVLEKAPVAYKTWGTLNPQKDNVMVICHALTGSSDVSDWWGPLLGPGRAFDTSIFFVFCGNVLGSPYGSASPVTLKPDSKDRYGPEFPVATSRDDVRAHKAVLDALGVRQVQFVIGGSMGGMQVMEWAFFGASFVKNIVPIATSGRQSAWCISWGESQRQAIYSDPNFCSGYYTDENPPAQGLAAARMQALLTYRSRNSFETRFGRNRMTPRGTSKPNGQQAAPVVAPTPSEQAVAQHNEGNKSPKSNASARAERATEALRNAAVASAASGEVFSAQSYLRYQGEKFIKRFDANCYIALTRKMDMHDVSRGRGDYEDVLRSIEQPTLVIGVETDGLFTISEQYELSELIPNAEIIIVHSFEGHDGFLLEFDQMNKHLSAFIRRQAPHLASDSYGSGEVITPEVASATGEVEGSDALLW